MAPALTEAIKQAGDTYEAIGLMFEDQPKHDAETLIDVLALYRGVLGAFPDILGVQKVRIVSFCHVCVTWGRENDGVFRSGQREEGVALSARR